MHFSNKGGGKHNLRHVGGDVPDCLRLTDAAASKKEEEKCGSGVRSQVQKTTTSSPKAKDEKLRAEAEDTEQKRRWREKRTQTWGRR